MVRKMGRRPGPDLGIAPTINVGARVDMLDLAKIVYRLKRLGVRIEGKSQILRQILFDAVRMAEQIGGGEFPIHTYAEAADILTEVGLKPPKGSSDYESFEKAYLLTEVEIERAESNLGKIEKLAAGMSAEVALSEIHEEIEEEAKKGGKTQTRKNGGAKKENDS